MRSEKAYCRHERQKVRNTGIGSQCILFMENLVERGIRPGMVVRWCVDLRPFLEYIERTHRITAVADLNRGHVEAYAAAVVAGWEAGEKTFTNAAYAEDLLSAVRMFCLYLNAAGVVPEDYGLSVAAGVASFTSTSAKPGP
jgi:hypothetical protein